MTGKYKNTNRSSHIVKKSERRFLEEFVRQRRPLNYATKRVLRLFDDLSIHLFIAHCQRLSENSPLKSTIKVHITSFPHSTAPTEHKHRSEFYPTILSEVRTATIKAVFYSKTA